MPLIRTPRLSPKSSWKQRRESQALSHVMPPSMPSNQRPPLDVIYPGDWHYQRKLTEPYQHRLSASPASARQFGRAPKVLLVENDERALRGIGKPSGKPTKNPWAALACMDKKGLHENPKDFEFLGECGQARHEINQHIYSSQGKISTQLFTNTQSIEKSLTSSCATNKVASSSISRRPQESRL